jgi:hypothetical protein
MTVRAGLGLSWRAGGGQRRLRARGWHREIPVLEGGAVIEQDRDLLGSARENGIDLPGCAPLADRRPGEVLPGDHPMPLWVAQEGLPIPAVEYTEIRVVRQF